MGQHRGWRVRQVRGRWVALVALGGGTERSRSFGRGKDELARARTWARDEAARMRAVPSAAVAALAGSRTVALARDYLEDLERRGRGESHLADVALILARLGKAVPDLGADDATQAIARWLRGLRTVSARTRNKYLVVAKSLANWAVQRQRLARSPATVIGEEREPDYLRPQFRVAELRHLLGQVDDPYYVTFAVLLYAGLRSTEAAELTWGAVDLAGGWLRVTGKGTKERAVPIQHELRAILEAVRRPRPDTEVCPPLCASRGRDFTRFLKRAAIAGGGRTPHSCRHTYAGLMTATGVPSLLLASYLGHASTGTTAGYAQLAAQYVDQVTGWPRGQFQLAPPRPPAEDFRAE